MHIDMNSYFPSVEEELNPKLKGKPVIVGGKTRRSVVCSANYIARKYGVKAAMPIYKAQQLCPNGIILVPNSAAYSDFHNQFINLVYKKFTKKIEDVSIDEFYIDATSLCRNVEPTLVALRIQNAIKTKIGLNCSIGIGNNKFMAKMASDYKKPLGITEFFNKDIVSKLWPMDIEDMYMVGEKTAILLRKNSINTIKDLANSNIDKLKKILGNTWEKYFLNANGKGCDIIENKRTESKSISSSETFLYDTNDYDEIIKTLKKECVEIWNQVALLNKNPRTITVFVKKDRFTSINKSFTPKQKIGNLEIFQSIALSIYEKNFIEKTIRLIGVNVKNFI